MGSGVEGDDWVTLEDWMEERSLETFCLWRDSGDWASGRSGDWVGKEELVTSVMLGCSVMVGIKEGINASFSLIRRTGRKLSRKENG